MNKMWSGRYYLTIICGLVFVYATIRHLLSAEAIVTIITMVFVSYFDKGGGDRKDEKTEEKPKEVVK